MQADEEVSATPVNLVIREGKLEQVTKDDVVSDDAGTRVLDGNCGYLLGRLAIGKVPGCMILSDNPAINLDVLMGTRTFITFAVIGSAILAVRAAYTKEAWNFVSIAIVATFVYFNFYRSYFEDFRLQFVARVIGTYAITLSVVALLLTLVDQCPWGVDNMLATKRIVVVAFPASMSATVADALKWFGHGCRNVIIA